MLIVKKILSKKRFHLFLIYLATCALGHIIDYTKPDITILCDICKCFLNVSELGPHTIYHNALQLYKFKVIFLINKIFLYTKQTNLGSSKDSRNDT